MSEKLTGKDLEQALKDRGLPDTGTADEKRAAVAAHDEGSTGAPSTGDNPDTTTLDSHLNGPSTTAPGDGPADTTDPAEVASSATPDKAAAAKAGHGTVNAVVKTGEVPKAPKATGHRVETYQVERPDGTKATVEHNIDTGSTSVL
ncbi:hypothetical protein HMPREF0063_10059 [Aeromicrobium marinum DSM 15272]|uniref:SAP domain-containing protein n=1 Tax=Aeromicrobium marinum DSM 15272 TaxID=585531 RepID=E2S7Q2_9ACTN|nr:hypothetical protein [Aeromicrobium marinum]EFQ84718.1 hypothetical protein HMPREF0063_10059 [Aeromicrobium marinum DSM 15272]